MGKMGRNGLVMGLVATLFASLTLASDADTYKALTEKHAAALITIKFIPQMPNGDKRSEVTSTGTVISPDGVILASNSQVGGNPMGGPGITPTEIEILFGEDTSGPKAEIIGRDSELDLAWLKITDELEKPLAYLDLKEDATPGIGDQVYSIRLMDEYFGRAPYVKSFKIAAMLKKPRKLIAPELVWNVDSEFVGLPTFSADGKTVGLFIVQLPDESSRQNRRPSDLIFLLPAKKVAIQTELALEQYAQHKAEQAENAADNAEAAEKPESAEAAEKAEAASATE